MSKTVLKDLAIKYEKYKWWLWFFVGLLVVVLFLLPYYTLKENAYFMIHDELDDGIFKYVLYAKNFGVNGNFIPEFMGGQTRASIMVSSLWGIFIYKIFEPYTAFAIMYTIVVLTGYVGVYLLGKEISENAFASFVAAAVFSYLPFKSMFALNIVGFPLFLWIIFRLAKCKGKDLIAPFIALIFYATGITLAWAGYMSIGFLSLGIVIVFLVGLVRGDYKKSEKSDKKSSGINIINLVICDVILCIAQFFISLDLIKSTFGPTSIPSHREEMVLNTRIDYLTHFKEMMYVGGSHSECCSFALAISALIMIVLVPIIVILFLKNKDEKNSILKKYLFLNIFYFANVFNSIFSVIWLSAPVVNLRNNIGGALKTFQVNRIYWIMPTCWMCVLILEIAICLDFAKLLLNAEKAKALKILSIIPAAAFIMIAGIYAKNVYFSSPFYHNIRLMVFPNSYHMDTWREYYSEALFSDIEYAIGKDKKDYRVVSVGFNPAVTLFNGFYTLDGYSTDYPLAYKHDFRRIIEDEIVKDEGMRGYFDNWGSRCYIFSAELPISTGLNNPTDTINELDINTAVLKDMGGDYIFSNAKIQNADDLGLKLMREEAFTNAESKYHIWVYEISPKD